MLSRIARILILPLAITMLCGVSRAELRAGAALRNITPETLIGITSGGPCREATEKKGELEVRVMVLEDGDTRVAFVSEPFIGFPAELCRRIAEQVEGVPAEHILIGATHTHGAPDAYGFPGLSRKLRADMDYLNRVCADSAAAINEAVANLQPARLRIATDRANGKIAYNYYAPQLYDPRCHVIQAVDTDGKVISTLVNYAIHPEVLLSKPIMTPDVIGPLQDRISEKEGGICVFMNSAQGGMVTADVRTPDGDNENWSECVRIGTLLADEALRIAASAEPRAESKLVVEWKNVNLPLPANNPLWRLVARGPVGFKINDDETITTRMNVVNVGNAQIMTIPGEALPNIGYYLKRKMHGEHNMIFGLTNDAFGYIMTRVDFDSFDRYKYISETSLGEMTGEILIEEGLALADSMPRPTK